MKTSKNQDETHVCPLLADKNACLELPEFRKVCNEVLGFGRLIITCKNQGIKETCWKRFYAAQKQNRKGEQK